MVVAAMAAVGVGRMMGDWAATGCKQSVWGAGARYARMKGGSCSMAWQATTYPAPNRETFVSHICS